MDLTDQGRRQVQIRRIRIRCVRGVTKVSGAAEGAVMSSWHDLPSLSSKPDGFRLDRYSKLATIALSIKVVSLICDPSSSDLADPAKLPPGPSSVLLSHGATGKGANHLWRIHLDSVSWITSCQQGC